MPLLLFAYFALEVLAFLGVAKWIGVGWALLAVLGLMALGGFLASVSLRGAVASAAEGRSSIGRLAGDSALLMVAWVLCMVPGFVTSFVGLLMIFPPTRALMRRSISASTQRSMEEFGVRVYEASPMSQMRTSYGTFSPEGGGAETNTPGTSTQGASSEVIDADELERWYRMDGPEDRRS